MIETTLIFVDGENLSIRYHEMVKVGRTPAPDNIVLDKCFVWNPRILRDHSWNIKRLAYYTSVVGDDDKVRTIREQISSNIFLCQDGTTQQTGQFVPFVRKRVRGGKKESVCDIAIAVDVMRACYRDHADTIWLFSGDGDFVQLLQEVMHSGKRAYASALSSGFNQEIRFVVDDFIQLDKYLFVEEVENSTVTA